MICGGKPVRVVGLVGLGLVLCTSGCATRKLSPEAQKIRNATFESVTTVGSHIPKRVRKGQEPDSNDGVSPVAVIEGDRVREMMQQMRPRR